MDKNKLAALVIVAIALVGGIVLTAKGVPVPTWLASLLTVLAGGFGWFAKPPGGDEKGGAP